MFDLQFYKLVNDTTSSVETAFKNPRLKQVLSNGGSIFDIIRSSGNRSLKRKNCKKMTIKNCNNPEEINDYYRAFYFVYAMPHIEYFKVC